MDKSAWRVIENMTIEELNCAREELEAALTIIKQSKVRAMVRDIQYSIELEAKLKR